MPLIFAVTIIQRLMKTDTINLFSSIKPSLMKKTLFKGTFIAFLGMIPMFYSTLYLPPSILSYWGILIFFVGLGMIALGMLPYRRLTFLENHPNKLSLINNEGMIYFQKEKKTFTIPFSAVEKMVYVEEGSFYGISICLKQTPHEKIIVHNPSFDMNRYQKYSRKWYQCDLFIPYFTKRSYDQIASHL
jgi:hypothetical protein